MVALYLDHGFITIFTPFNPGPCSLAWILPCLFYSSYVFLFSVKAVTEKQNPSRIQGKSH